MSRRQKQNGLPGSSYMSPTPTRNGGHTDGREKFTEKDSWHGMTHSHGSGIPIRHQFNDIPVLSQQSIGAKAKLQVSTPGDKYEQEADRMADMVTAGKKLADTPVSAVATTGSSIQRKAVFADDSQCIDYNKCKLVTAWDVASGMVNEAITAVDDVANNGNTSPHFGKVDGRFPGASKAQLTTLSSVLNSIKTELNSPILTNCKATSICKGAVMAATTCSANAEIEFCSQFFTGADCRTQAAAIIHEIAHHIVCLINPVIEVTNKENKKEKTGDVYRHFPEFGSLTTVQALKNADSFAVLCLDLSNRNDCFDCSMNMQLGNKEYKKFLEKIKKENKAPEKEEAAGEGSKKKIQRKCAKCEEEEETGLLQAKSIGTKINMTSSTLVQQIQNSKGRGQQLDRNTQSFMESGFGADFGKVRIHADQQSAEMNHRLNAYAFTIGNDIYFNRGAYKPATTAGKKLLAHELTHTLQQDPNSSKSSTSS